MGFRVLIAIGLALCLLCAGCVKIPQASVTLSEELHQMILSAQASHRAFIRAYVQERRAQADLFVDSVWVPTFMGNFLQQSGILGLIEGATSNGEKGQLLLEFGTSAAITIEERRSALHSEFDQIEWVLDSAVTAHYDDMLMVNASLTAHLRSAASVTRTRDELLDALHLQPERLIPLDLIDNKLSELMHFKGKVEDVRGKVDEIRDILETNAATEE